MPIAKNEAAASAEPMLRPVANGGTSPTRMIRIPRTINLMDQRNANPHLPANPG